MIHNIVEENMNWALAKGIRHLLACGVKEDSRNGPVLVAPQPVCTTYTKPLQRVLFSPVRNANPFFHFMEALWMLAGCNDVAWPSYFASGIKQYSDDAVTLHGAYGHRWLKHFETDQITYVIEELTKRPQSRRAVIGMWDPLADVEAGLKVGLDVPCNTHAYFSIKQGKLDMLVSCRSNDIIWGAYGANAVHFSFLQEYIAHWLKVPVGFYRQLSYNFHAYLDNYPESELRRIAADSENHNDYGMFLKFLPLVDEGLSIEAFDAQLLHFLAKPDVEVLPWTPFFAYVALPMYRAWTLHKEKKPGAIEVATLIKADDWRMACTKWLQRAEAKRARKTA